MVTETLSERSSLAPPPSVERGNPVIPSGLRIPGVQLLEIPYDPTTLPSEHVERIHALDAKIAEKDRDRIIHVEIAKQAFKPRYVIPGFREKLWLTSIKLESVMYIMLSIFFFGVSSFFLEGGGS